MEYGGHRGGAATPPDSGNAIPFRRSDPEHDHRQRKDRTMKDKRTDRESTLTELRRISEQLDSHSDRLEGMGLLIDAQLSFLRDSSPTDETIENLRALMADRIDRESNLISGLAQKLETIAAGIPAE